MSLLYTVYINFVNQYLLGGMFVIIREKLNFHVHRENLYDFRISSKETLSLFIVHSYSICKGISLQRLCNFPNPLDTEL